MVFNSEIFLLFAALFFPAYFLAPTVRLQNMIALLGSYVFYGWWDWRFLFLIGFTTVFNFYAAQQVNGEKRRFWIWTSVIVNLGILGVFKYFNFFVGGFLALLEGFGLGASEATWSIILPVGISFFTFQAMSYVLDVSRGQLEPRNSLLTFATYIALFPQLVAGPIVRAARLMPQLTGLRRFRWANLWLGLELVVIGAVLKIVVADRLAPLVDRTFIDPENAHAAELLLGTVFFAFQIYGDFAGYSLMAIGLGRIMGLSFPRNFKRPYLAEGFSDFWQRWHISLSSWLRDYLYIPLGGNRGGSFGTGRNLMLTMLLGGLWHGAALTFVFWGGLHGSYLIIERALRQRLSWSGMVVVRRWMNRALVFAAVCVAWVFFRAETFGDAVTVLGGIATPQALNLGAVGNKFQVLIALMMIVILMVSEILYEDSAGVRRLMRKRTLRMGWIGVLLLSLPFLGTFNGGAFVYFQF